MSASEPYVHLNFTNFFLGVAEHWHIASKRFGVPLRYSILGKASEGSARPSTSAGYVKEQSIGCEERNVDKMLDNVDFTAPARLKCVRRRNMLERSGLFSAGPGVGTMYGALGKEREISSF